MRYAIRMSIFVGFMTVCRVVLPAQKAVRDESPAITIRVMNSKTGRPLKNVNVTLEDTTGRFLKNAHGKIVAGTTNNLGEVILKLSSPVPERLTVFYVGGGTCELGQCSTRTFPTAEILKVGVIASNCSDPKSPYKGSPRAGELVIFGTPFSRTECMMLEMP